MESIAPTRPTLAGCWMWSDMRSKDEKLQYELSSIYLHVNLDTVIFFLSSSRGNAKLTCLLGSRITSSRHEIHSLRPQCLTSLTLRSLHGAVTRQDRATYHIICTSMSYENGDPKSH